MRHYKLIKRQKADQSWEYERVRLASPPKIYAADDAYVATSISDGMTVETIPYEAPAEQTDAEKAQAELDAYAVKLLTVFEEILPLLSVDVSKLSKQSQDILTARDSLRARI